MKKNNNSLIVILSVLTITAIVGGLAYYLSGPVINWNSNYLPTEKSPYGTHIIKTLLQQNKQNQTFKMIEDSVHLELQSRPSGSPASYVYIGDYYYGNEKDIDSLLQFVKAGNSAFIIAEYIQSEYMFQFLEHAIIQEEELPDTTEIIASDEYLEYEGDPYYEEEVFDDTEEEYAYDPYDHLKSLSYYAASNDYYIFPKTKRSAVKSQVTYRYEFDTIPYNWSFLDEAVFDYYDEDSVKVLGTFKEGANALYRDKINFFRIKKGNGYIYIHTTPLAFTNIHMLEEKNMQYARDVFSYIPSGTIYWDEENRTQDRIKREREKAGMPDESPLEFILSEPALRKAWYILLSLLILYLIFGAKRRQRVIPIMERKDNTSIEYAEVISQLFLEQTDHTKLIALKTELFRAHIRDRFNIKITDETNIDDTRLISNLATRTNVRYDLIKSILKEEILLRSHTVIDTGMMLSYHSKLEEFYSLSK